MQPRKKDRLGRKGHYPDSEDRDYCSLCEEFQGYNCTRKCPRCGENTVPAWATIPSVYDSSPF